MGNAEVRVTFKARKHDLNVSTFALVILLLFEDIRDDQVLTYEVRILTILFSSRPYPYLTSLNYVFAVQEIESATSIPEAELKRQLQSLACAKFKVLKKHPPGRDVNAGDSFSFNADFSAPLQKIKINTIASRVENTEERKETKDRVDEERKHQTEVRLPLSRHWRRQING